MIVFGLILVLLAVGAGVVLFLATQSLTTPVNLELSGYNWGMTPLALLITGAVAMLLLWFGLGIIRGSVKRRRRPAREAKEAEGQAKIEESIRADERARAEESHQSSLAERDRVRDEEFQTRLADRDSERDTELAAREQEFAAREQAAEQRVRDNEDRVRAEERSKVEREFTARTAAAGAGGAGGTAAETDTEADEVHDLGHGAAEAPRVEAAGTPDAADPAGSTGQTAAEGDGTAEDHSSHPAYRTVADKIMGRDPVDPA